MHAYYSAQDTLPTYGAFQTEADLEKYRAYRQEFLTHKLYLPRRYFIDLDILQFGPDAGDDSLVYALWGAHLRLVEPNPKALTVLHASFQHYKLERFIRYVCIMPLEKWATTTDSELQVDFVDACGFIQTVDPDIWMPLFRRVLKPGGLCLISYPETCGMEIDLLHKDIYQQAKNIDPTITAEDLFRTKWNTIPHTRSFEAWVMDELENPFFTAAQTYETNSLDRQMMVAGFRLYSSYPDRKNCGAVHWHKLTPDRTFERETHVKLLQSAISEKYVVEKTRQVLEQGDILKLRLFCNHDADFLRAWSLPYQFSVYERI